VQKDATQITRAVAQCGSGSSCRGWPWDYGRGMGVAETRAATTTTLDGSCGAKVGQFFFARRRRQPRLFMDICNMRRRQVELALGVSQHYECTADIPCEKERPGPVTHFGFARPELQQFPMAGVAAKRGGDTVG